MPSPLVLASCSSLLSSLLLFLPIPLLISSDLTISFRSSFTRLLTSACHVAVPFRPLLRPFLFPSFSKDSLPCKLLLHLTGQQQQEERAENRRWIRESGGKSGQASPVRRIFTPVIPSPSQSAFGFHCFPNSLCNQMPAQSLPPCNNRCPASRKHFTLTDISHLTSNLSAWSFDKEVYMYVCCVSERFSPSARDQTGERPRNDSHRSDSQTIARNNSRR